MAKSYEELMMLVEKTTEIAASNTESTAVVLAKLQAQERLIGGLSNVVKEIDERVSSITDDIDQLKLNEEITTIQSSTIRNAAQNRIVEILGPDLVDRAKYFRTFIQRLYTDARKMAGLGSKIECTKKCDYQRVIDFIEAWIPTCGCAELKIYADEKAQARKTAKELGYTA